MVVPPLAAVFAEANAWLILLVGPKVPSEKVGVGPEQSGGVVPSGGTNPQVFEVPLAKVPQVTSIRFWRAVGGRTTSERGAETAVPHLRAIRDSRGRIIAVMTFNTDVSDSFEREGEDPEFFHEFSRPGYALGIDILLYALTH